MEQPVLSQYAVPVGMPAPYGMYPPQKSNMSSLLIGALVVLAILVVAWAVWRPNTGWWWRHHRGAYPRGYGYGYPRGYGRGYGYGYPRGRGYRWHAPFVGGEMVSNAWVGEPARLGA
jgi:uncharacterized membrane protein